jgi:hypothetical protein
MSRPLLLLIALVSAGFLAVAGALFLGQDQNAGNVRFGQGHAASVIFLPAKSRPEERIIRHPMSDGSAVDDVLMRDQTTKRIVYDSKMVLRQVFAYFKGPSPEEQGALMYEKTHDGNGHLFSERHLRLDGSLEMDGHFNPADTTYVRQLYYPASTPSTGQDAADLVVSAEKTFDKWWHPVSETDFRPDATRKLLHTWGDGLDETVSTFSDDGKKFLQTVTTGRGKHYEALYYPDGANIDVEYVNTYDGTIFQWYQPDHKVILKATFRNTGMDEFVLPSPKGEPLYRQVWSKDYSGTEVDGEYPLVLEHVDLLKDGDEGKIDTRYVIDRTGVLTAVVVFLGDTEYGARMIYKVGADGWATSVETYDDKSNSDGGKALTQANGKRFVLGPLLTRPSYQLPKLADGLKLRGDPPYYGPM